VVCRCDGGRSPRVFVSLLRAAGFDDDGIVELVTISSATVAATTIADTLNIRPQDGAELDGFEAN
jgi:hypothetical protein